MSVICRLTETTGGGGSVNIDVNLNCTASELVRDAVYMLSSSEVRRANNSDISTAKVVGFIVSKDTDTTCTVRFAGILSGFTGLEVGKQYFLDSSDGAITKTPTTSAGSVLVRIGQPTTTADLMININNNYTLRS